MSTGNRKTISPDDLCLNCMTEMEGYDLCPLCGWQKGTPPKEPYQLMPGVQLNERYVIGTVIDFGGFGIIYIAWDMSLKQKVAIKEYFPASLANRIPRTKEVNVHGGKYKEQYSHGLQRFIDEAKSLAMFSDYPGIVSVYNYFRENNTAYIVMEYLEGISLKQYLEQCGGKLPYRQVLSIAGPLFDTLAEVHSKKIIHRDLSPDNIYITVEGNVKLIDFGAARLNDGEELETREAVLKPGYAPPEQYRSKGKHSVQTDIYAFAAMLYQMITGEIPPESMNRMVCDELKPVSEYELDEPVPKEIENAVLRGLAIERSIRFKNAREFEAAISMVKVSDPPEIIRKKRRFRTRLAIVFGVLLAAGVIAFIPVWNTYLHPDEVLTGGEIHDAEISVLVCEEDFSVFTEIADAFMQEYNLIHVSLLSTGAQSYEQVFTTLKEQKQVPTIYFSNLVSEDKQVKNFELKRLYENTEITNYLYFDQMSYEGSDWLAVTLDFPVMYYNIDMINEIDYDATKLSEFSFVGNLDELLPQEDIYTVALGISEKCEELFKNCDGYISKDIFDLSNTDISARDFIGEGAAVYIDVVSHMREIQQGMPGYVGAVVYPIEGEKIVGEFLYELSISKRSSRYEKDAALLFLNFLMNDYAQNILALQNNKGFPLNGSLTDSFFESHKDLEEYSELIKEIEIIK